ncbi:enoyl-CoA hydratase-related protein [Mycobacterium sp. OTB74]|jgi:enoyl-CoA hydratase/carnithine racemase|uniref:enoyl-CoA hydratase/isomerase family protein n=1 Tax=Mycobacterium sp. OTB74 TaxID=1853452 RepID=UPI00247403F5|nr:enoyl-CoA hydratase-related protein [Mycobacterium sp. OTB74]MDH6242742.1 enoyl-CoA hydratase/carnithine racemase [Mycobacterium sp. OTB74]
MSLKETIAEGVAWLTLDSPERLNAFTGSDYRDLRVVLQRALAAPSVRVIVLTGSGRAFSAGADRSLVDGTASPSELERAGAEFAAMLDILGRCEKPIIAAVNGLAVGIGCTMLLYCDLVLMGESARLRLPFTALGMVPEAGSSALLPARARWADTVWAMLSGEWIDAQTAYRMGIAWQVVPESELVDSAGKAASTIAALDPAAVAGTKRLLIAGRADVARGAMDREIAEMAALFGHRGGNCG